jgi:hypothetical protein
MAWKGVGVLGFEMKPEEWYSNKRSEYKKVFGNDWSHVDPWSCHSMAGYCYETMIRMGAEKRYFGITTQDEDVMIANAIMIREALHGI